MSTNKISDPSATLVTSQRVPERLAGAWLAAHPRWFAGIGEPLAEAPQKHDLVRMRSELGPVLVKRDRPGARKAALEAIGLRRPRARRAFEHSLALVEAGLGVPSPYAWLSTGVTEHGSFFLREFVQGESLADLLADGEPSDTLLGAVAEFVARLHRERWRHRDLKAPNLLVRGLDSDAPEIVVVDLDGLWRSTGRVRQRGRRRDLGRLCVSFRAAGVADLLWSRLLEHYLNALEGSVDPEQLRSLERDTLTWADAKRRRNERRGLPVA